MIEIQRVAVTYANSVRALVDVSLRVEKGEFVFLVGTTGAGKSTLLRLINRELLPTSGRVIVSGQDVAELRYHQIPHFRRQMGVVFQDYELLPNLSVWENVAFVLRVLGMGRKEVRQRTTWALELVGLLKRCRHRPEELSGGEQQRVAIARAIVNEPPLLLADEPTGNLDPDTSWDIMQLLSHINARGTTVVVASHDFAVIERMNRRIVRLEAGQVVSDTPAEVYNPEIIAMPVVSASADTPDVVQEPAESAPESEDDRSATDAPMPTQNTLAPTEPESDRA